MTKQTRVHFSKKLLVYFILIMFSTNLYSAPKEGKVNVDPKPIEDLLNRFYDICQDSYHSNDDKKYINLLKPLFNTNDNDRLAIKLANCRSNVKQRFASDRDTKLDMTRQIKVRGVSYRQNQRAYNVSFFLWADEHKTNSGSHTFFIRPVKNANGKVEWKFL